MTWHNRNLYLLGLPGAGKSAIGQALAELLGDHEFLDLDCTIERDSSHTIAEIFATTGEAAFRKLETEALLTVAAAKGQPKIIATGGGIVMSPLNRAIMRGSGIPIWIDVTVRDAASNVLKDILRGHARPMFRASSEEELREKLSKLLEMRRPFYEQAILHFVLRNPKALQRSADELAQEVVIALDQMSHNVVLAPRHRTLVAQSAFGNYPILVGSGIASRELHFLVKDRGLNQIIAVMDREIERLHWPELCEKLTKSLGPKISIEEIVIEGGESGKTLPSVLEILDRIDNLAAERRSTLVVAFGGGVITDMAGFAASLYHRGLPIVHIPTTLIAQADASIGGKTGVDHFNRKNSIGTFYSPQEVIVDPLYLKTLPKRERLAGLAEVFKYALIGNADLWKKLSKRLRRLVRGVDAAYEDVIFDAIVEKLRYVEPDEFERTRGVRELLNFGHTFGHALEAAGDFQALRHGEAVLFGMRTAAWLSKELGHLEESEWVEIELVLGRIPIAGSVTVPSDRIHDIFRRDKKGKNRVILLRSIGEAFVAEISEEDARRSMDYMLSLE